jgi:hypothetical protein
VSLSAENPALGEGAWIFVSHSHRDLREVRRVRDALEAKGHQPLLFFLKCLDDDSEIDDLIRREIEARQFFLLCDSPNARASRWVQQEADLIKSFSSKISVNLELDSDWEAQLAAVRELSRRATIYIDSLWTSAALASEIADGLRVNDYRVFADIDDIRRGETWLESIHSALDEALNTGYVLLLLSPKAFESPFIRATLQYVAGRPSSVVVIIESDREETLSLLASIPDWPMIGSHAPLDFTTGQFDENFAGLLRVLSD